MMTAPLPGPVDPLTVNRTIWLAMGLIRRGRLDEAERHLERIADHLDRLGGQQRRAERGEASTVH